MHVPVILHADEYNFPKNLKIWPDEVLQMSPGQNQGSSW